VLSFRRETVNPLYMRNMTNEETVIDRGKRLVTLSNCASCHKVGVWPSRIDITGTEDENNVGAINVMTLYAARHILTDGRQVEKISDEELAILAKKGITILYRKGTWLTPTVGKDLLMRNIRRILVYGEGEGAVKELVVEGMAPPVIVGEGAKVNPEWLFSFLMAPTPIRPWMQAENGDYAKMGVRMPTFGFTDDEATLLVQHFSYISGEKTPFRYDPPRDKAAQDKLLATGKAVFELRQCAKCHVVAGTKVVTDTPAPAFADVAPRIQKDWFEPWIRNPKSFAPGTGMTAFGEDMVKPEEVEALREYIWSLHGK
jgi:mono/diheme cytochrome c family protein